MGRWAIKKENHLSCELSESMKIKEVIIKINVVDGTSMKDIDYIFITSEKISILFWKDMGILGEILREQCGGKA